MAKYLKLGDRAGYFYDPYTEISIAKNEVVEVKNSDLFGKKIRAAISSGHIVLTDDPKLVKNTDEKEAILAKFSKLTAKFKKDGVYDLEKIGSKLNDEEVKLLAEYSEVTIEEGDSKEEILKAILS